MHILIIIGCVVIALILISFIVYFFNLDMKIAGVMQAILRKHYDRIPRDRRL